MYEELVLVTLLAFTIIGLYGAGSLINRRKSNKILMTIWRQLKRLDVPGEYRTLGSSGFIISLTEINKRIKRIDVSLVLEKREFPLNWAIDRLKGKRDTITISIIYNNQIYDKEIELFRKGNYYGDAIMKYRKKVKKLNGDIYIYPGDLELDTKIRKLQKILKEYGEVYLISIKRGKKILTIISGIKIMENIYKLIKRLISI